MGKTTDELLNELVAESAVGCWARQLTGDAAEFVAAVREREAAGLTLRREAIRAVLKREWDIHVGLKALRNHIRSTCACD